MKKDPYADLTWEDIEDWAGTTIVSRGRTYQRNNSVSDLGITPEGTLIAWVLGSVRYVTQVAIHDGNLTSGCTCPYWANCKHAVAVVLEYLTCLKNGVAVPEISQTDPRLNMLQETETTGEEYWDLELGRWTDIEEQLETEQQQNTGPLLAYLKKQTRAQLVELLDELTDAFPDVREFIEERRKVRSGNASTLLKAIRQELADIREGPDWDEYEYEYDQEYQPVSFNRLKTYLQALLIAGPAEELLQVGKELINTINFAIDNYDIDGGIIDEVPACMEIVIQALPSSSLSSSEQLIWAVDMDLADENEFCYDVLENIWNNAKKKSDWHELADELHKRLTAIRSDNELRRPVTEWLIAAFEQTGREDEIIPLREREAETTGDYIQLIDLLIDEKYYEDAENWCHKAIANTNPNHPGTISNLEDRLRTIREKTGDHLSATTFYANDFFAQPSLHTFQELCKAARKAKVEPAVEAWARYFLETGHLPRTKGRKRKGEPNDKWPLPATEFKKDSDASEGPMIHLLIELAIAEKKPTEVLKWYDLKAPTTHYSWGYMYTSSLNVAQAIKEKYPDRAIEIWKEQAESAISRVQVSGYQEAGTYLREVRDTLKRLNREKEWDAYLSELRNENKRRPRCLEVLDGLAGKRIIDGT